MLPKQLLTKSPRRCTHDNGDERVPSTSARDSEDSYRPRGEKGAEKSKPVPMKRLSVSPAKIDGMLNVSPPADSVLTSTSQPTSSGFSKKIKNSSIDIQHLFVYDITPNNTRISL